MRLAPSQLRALALLVQYNLPSLRDFDLSTLLAVRRDDEAFSRFRRKLEEVLSDTALQFDTRIGIEASREMTDEQSKSLVRQYRHRLEAIIQPEIDRLNSSLRTNPMEKFFVPIGTPFAVGILGSALFHDDPYKALIGAGGAAIAALLSEAARKLPPGARRNRALLRAYVDLSNSG